MTDKGVYLKAFNNQLKEFIEDVKVVFPDNHELQVNANTLNTIRSANSKLVLSIWHQYVTIKYKDKIDSGDTDYFIEKDYTNDIDSGDANANKVYINFINSIRTSIKGLDDVNKEKAMKYIKNLTTLTSMYFQ
tara:strand:- start:37 stop:435 length:399 start_codon:yes stop_codon:yes gene_type:complete